MNTFGLDKSFSQFDFEEIKVDEVIMVSGGSSGGSGGFDYPSLPTFPIVGQAAYVPNVPGLQVGYWYG